METDFILSKILTPWSRMNQSYWLGHLPLVILGLRVTVKNDLKCLSAEMVHSTTLRLPEQFFLRPPQLLLDMTSFVDRLTLRMANLAYNSSAQCQRPTYTPKLLQTCTHVFVRDLAQTHTLQPSYRGPFKVLKRHPKFFEVEIKKQVSNYPRQYSVDSLKPASLGATWLSMDNSETPPPTPGPNVLKETVTRSGHHVRWSKLLYYC